MLAHAVFERLIAPADALLDLHGGDMVEALEPFTLYDESAVEDRARELAIAFRLPYVVRNRVADAPIGARLRPRRLGPAFRPSSRRREDAACSRRRPSGF